MQSRAASAFMTFQWNNLPFPQILKNTLRIYRNFDLQAVSSETNQVLYAEKRQNGLGMIEQNFFSSIYDPNSLSIFIIFYAIAGASLRIFYQREGSSQQNLGTGSGIRWPASKSGRPGLIPALA